MRTAFLYLIVFLICSSFIFSYAQQDPIDLFMSNSIEATGNIGSVEIKVKNFSDIISFQASINWDPSLLAFAGVSDFGISDLNEDNFGTVDAGKGHVRFVWEPSNATALTLDDSTTIFVAKFEFIANDPQEVPIGFSDTISNPSFPIEFANSSYEVLNVNTFNGSITFFDEITGLQKLYEEGISIYPNPFDAAINISNKEGSIEYIQILDLHGKKINEFFNIKDQFIKLSLSGSPNGIYLLNIGKNGKNLTRKVVKSPIK